MEGIHQVFRPTNMAKGSTVDNRNAKRKRIQVGIEIADPGANRCYGYAENISSTGVSIVLQEGGLPAGQRSVILNFKIWTGSETLYRKIYARVVRSGQGKIALEFARSLAARDYESAHAMTSRSFQAVTSPGQLKNAFESIVPLDWGPVEPVELGETMTSWPGKQATDLGWVYVSIGGDVYSEAVSVIVMSENGSARIREVEFGRP